MRYKYPFCENFPVYIRTEKFKCETFHVVITTTNHFDCFLAILWRPTTTTAATNASEIYCNDLDLPN